MSRRTYPVLIGIVVALALLGLAFSNHQELRRLRSERDQVVAKLGSQETPSEAPVSPAAPAAPSAIINAGDETEILKLRGEIAQLSRRKRELASVMAENAQLKTQVASATTNSGPKLPPGYIRRSQARMAGFGTPESTMESLLYSIQNHDLQSLLLAFTPEAAQQIQANLARNPDKDFFEKSAPIPGIAVTRSVQKTDDSVELTLEIAPGVSTGTLLLRKIDGSWKISTPMF